MNFRKLITYLTMGTAAAMPIATAQNPTILQGSYISNVFGNSNFVLNPNAQTNTANVTVSSASVARSITTPLVATSEFNITTSTSTGYADWALRTFDAGMKNNNCEARFTYRGFTVGSTKAQILQGANVVAELTLVGDANDPRIASINFPCGDLLAVTKFRLQQASASLTGTNEISGIYVGLATNMANVAQAELVGTWTMTGATNCIFALTVTSYDDFNVDSDCNDPVVTGNVGKSQGKRPWINIINPKPGNYYVVVSATFESPTNVSQYVQLKNSAATAVTRHKLYSQSGIANYPTSLTLNMEYTSGSLEFQLGGYTTNAANALNLSNANSDTNLKFTVYRFPSSSELVVTPERQNVFGGVEWSATADWTGTATTYTTVNVGSSWGTPSTFGSATIAATGCGLAANDVGFCIDTLPPGIYKIGGNFQLGVKPAAANNYCAYSANIGGGTLTENRVIDALPRSATSSTEAVPFVNLGTGLFKVTSLQKNVRVWLHYRKDAGATNCTIRSDNANYYAKPSLHITPVDQPSNSALYVQGPVLGSQTGAAIAAGYVGSVKSTTVENSLSYNTTASTITTLTVTPGVYIVTGMVYPRATMTGARVWVDTSASVEPSSVATNLGRKQSIADGDRVETQPVVLNVTGTTIYLRGLTSTGTTTNAGASIYATQIN